MPGEEEMQMTDRNLEDRLRALIEKYALKIENADWLEQARIREDFRIDGDDAHEFLEEYSAEFGVDVSGMKFENYFFRETDYSFFGIFSLFRRQPSRSLRVIDLINGAERKILN